MSMSVTRTQSGFGSMQTEAVTHSGLSESVQKMASFQRQRTEVVAFVMRDGGQPQRNIDHADGLSL